MAKQQDDRYADESSFPTNYHATTTSGGGGVLRETDGNVMLLYLSETKESAPPAAKGFEYNVNNDIFRDKKLPTVKTDHPVNRSILLLESDNDDTSSVDTAELIRRLRGSTNNNNGDDPSCGCSSAGGGAVQSPQQEASKMWTAEAVARKDEKSLLGLLPTSRSPESLTGETPRKGGSDRRHQDASPRLFSWQLPIGSDVSDHVEDDEGSVATAELQRRLRSRFPTESTNTIIYNTNTGPTSATLQEPPQDVKFVLPFHFASSSSSSDESDDEESTM
jgi:hypothetical protein